MANFLDKIAGLEVIERHTRELANLDESEQREIIELYRRLRRSLVTRLRASLAVEKQSGEARFSSQKLRGTLAQLEAAISQFSVEFNKRVEGHWSKGAELSISHLEEQIAVFDETFAGAVTPINIPGILIANERKNYLVNNYQASINRWSQFTREKLADDLQAALVTQETTQETIGRMIGDWQAKEWQLRRIVRTELHNVYNTSKIPGLQSAQSQIPDLRKALLHPMDHRTAEDSTYLAELNPIIPIDEPFKYVWQPSPTSKKYYREFMAPPDRPNDRAVLVPYSARWDN